MGQLTFFRPDPISTAFFLAVVAFVAAAFPVGAHLAGKRAGETSPRAAFRTTARTAAFVAAWFCLLAGVVQSGELVARPLPNLPIALGLFVGSAIIFGFTRTGGLLARGLPVGLLVAFQGFRLPLELILHDWANQAVIPRTMTWDGRNWDVAAGVLALLLAGFADKSRVAAWVANVVGIGLLANVVRVAILSSPLPFAWPVEPPLQLAFHLPYAFILACVAGAAAGHVILTRKLLSKV